MWPCGCVAVWQCGSARGVANRGRAGGAREHGEQRAAHRRMAMTTRRPAAAVARERSAARDWPRPRRRRRRVAGDRPAHYDVRSAGLAKRPTLMSYAVLRCWAALAWAKKAGSALLVTLARRAPRVPVRHTTAAIISSARVAPILLRRFFSCLSGCDHILCSASSHRLHSSSGATALALLIRDILSARHTPFQQLRAAQKDDDTTATMGSCTP